MSEQIAFILGLGIGAFLCWWINQMWRLHLERIKLINDIAREEIKREIRECFEEIQKERL
jgi:hypothetical protein